MSQAELETLKLFVQGGTSTKYSTLTSLAFLIYDHLITLDSEIHLVWKREWTNGKSLFLFNRYFGLFVLLFDVIVLFSHGLTDVLYVFTPLKGIGLAHAQLYTAASGSYVGKFLVILTARVHAVYNRDKRVTAIIVFAFVSATISSTVIDYVGIPDSAAVPFGLTGCYMFNVPKFYKYTWIPPLICETVQCSFMLLKAWKLYREKRDFPLLMIIVRDSFWYYLTAFSILLVNCLIWDAAPQSLSEVAIGWGVAIPCAMGSRLLLNMRERYLQENTILSASGSLSFAPPVMRPFMKQQIQRKGAVEFTFNSDELSGSTGV